MLHEPDQFGEVHTVTLGQAKAMIAALSSQQSILLLSQPGVGKSDIVEQSASDADLPLRSLLGTQIAPEDVSGIPKIDGERSVFCPPRILMPEDDQPFVLFLDELPATSPEVQKAFYSILLERRIGEFRLPEGTRVVAAGNRVEDQSLVRVMSAALINRVTVLHIRVDRKEWFQWAQKAGIRGEILSFLAMTPEALVREVPKLPVPFSTPRSWERLSRSLDLAEEAGILNAETIRALSFGTVSAEDAAIFSEMSANEIEVAPITDYIFNGREFPGHDVAALFIVRLIRGIVKSRDGAGYEEFMSHLGKKDGKKELNNFLLSLSNEHRSALLIGMVQQWKELGAGPAAVRTLRETLGVKG